MENSKNSEDPSHYEIPNEHHRDTTDTAETILNQKNLQSHGPKLQEPKQFAINAVRDSSPMKTISTC